MKIFGPGAYSISNKGDAALVRVYLDWIRRALDADEIVLTSFTPSLDMTYYGVPVLDMPLRPFAIVHQLSARIMSRTRFSRAVLRRWRLRSFKVLVPALAQWARFYRSHPRLTAALTPRRLMAIARVIDASDACVAVPGGYLNAPTPDSDWWLFHVPTLVLCKELGKRLILSPCSIGPYTDQHRPIASHILCRVDAILVREDASAGVCADLGVEPSRVLRTPDLGFGFVYASDELDYTWAATILPGDHTDYLGVSVRFHTFPGAADPRAAQRAYLDAVADSVEQVVEMSTDAVPVIVPQVLEDLAIGEELAARLRQRGIQPLNLTDDLTPLQLCALYERLRLLIGTRMHANILAMSVGTPVVAIGYEPKTHGILSDMGLLDWFIAIEDTGKGRLRDLALAQWETAPSLRTVAKDRAEVQAAALSAAATAVRKLLAD